MEKKRKEEEELDSTFTKRSQNSDMEESGICSFILNLDEYDTALKVEIL